jgi:aspartokinase-like uncharacterized kinase
MRAVVKIGGSTADQPEMGVWVAALARSRLPIIIVPGGGPFADQVRAAQPNMGFSDRAAHAMAILAMDQFGYVILDRHEKMAPARSLADFERAIESGMVPVWLPSTMAIPASDIEASWDVTSDSLAAWLVGKLGAEGLLLIKQTSAFSDRDDIDSLAAKGIVDAAFAEMLPVGIDLHIAGPDDAATAHALLSSGCLPGVAVRSPETSEKKTA